MKEKNQFHTFQDGMGDVTSEEREDNEAKSDGNLKNGHADARR